MPELRWILLGLGVLFCLGLWWWESRRGRQAADSRAGLAPGDVRRPAAEAQAVQSALRPWNETVDIEEELSDAVRTELESPREAPAEVPIHYVGAARFDDEIELALPKERRAPDPAIAGERFSRARSFEPTHNEFDDAEPGEPMIDIAAERPQRATQGPLRIEPVIGDVAAAVGASQSSASASQTAVASGAPQPRPEKIVALRVAAPPLERFEGRALVAALRSAGLEHGKFSIFHKQGTDGTTLFSVASLVEPGTFDLQAIDGRRFPGVSFFTVLGSTPDGGATVEDMLGTARTLAAALQGTLQDERGAPLSPQRLADLRAEVAAWVRQGQ